MKLPTFRFEKELWQKGYQFVCGLDEVGRGAWAGPVVAAAVIFSQQSHLQGHALQTSKAWPCGTLCIRDSKQLSPLQREELDPRIRQNCLAYSIAEVNVKTINREGIGKATQRSFRKCLKSLQIPPDFLLIDAFYVKNLPKKNQKPIIKGDQKSISIAAASIVAKVYRDNLMRKLHEKVPQYGFDRHKGYGTKLHQELLKKHGLSPHHRLAFIPDHLLRVKSPRLSAGSQNLATWPRKAAATTPGSRIPV